MRKTLRHLMPCRVFAFVSVAACANAASAQSGEALLFKPWHERAVFDGEITAMGSFPRNSSGGRAGLWEAAAEGRVRLDQSHELNPSIGYQAFRLDTTREVKGLPDSLTNMSAAFASPIGMIGEWFVAVSAGAGVTRDDVWHAGSSWYPKASVTTGRKLSERSDLVIWIEYDGNATLFPDLPIPGIAYVMRVNDRFEFVLGIPDTELTWRPVEGLTLQVTWQVPSAIEAEAEVKLSQQVALYAQYRNQTRAFRPAGLAHNDRLFFDEQSVEAGFRFGAEHNVTGEVGIGFAFERQFSVGFDQRGLATTVSLSDAAFLRFGLKISF